MWCCRRCALQSTCILWFPGWCRGRWRCPCPNREPGWTSEASASCSPGAEPAERNAVSRTFQWHVKAQWCLLTLMPWKLAIVCRKLCFFYKPDLTELNGAFGKCSLSARLHHYKDKRHCMDRKKANSETHVSAGQMLARVIRCFEKCQNEANVLK